MPDPQIRKWTMHQVDYDHPDIVSGPLVDRANPVLVVEAAPVIAALDAIAAELVTVVQHPSAARVSWRVTRGRAGRGISAAGGSRTITSTRP